jgi:hypothetical protein
MKNWKTTLIGCGGAVIIAVAKVIATGNLDADTIIKAAVIALLGLFAKDSNVTGGTVRQ